MERRRQEQRRHPSTELLSSGGSERQRQRHPPTCGSPHELCSLTGASLSCAEARQARRVQVCRFPDGWKEPREDAELQSPVKQKSASFIPWNIQLCSTLSFMAAPRDTQAHQPNGAPFYLQTSPGLDLLSLFACYLLIPT